MSIMTETKTDHWRRFPVVLSVLLSFLFFSAVAVAVDPGISDDIEPGEPSVPYDFDMKVSDFIKVQEEAKQLAVEVQKKLEVDDQYWDMARDAAAEAVKIFETEEYKSEFKKHKDWVRKRSLEMAGMEDIYGDDAPKKEDPVTIANALGPQEQLYVFISSSIPVQTLRNYAFDIERVHEDNIRMIMRGFVGSMTYFGPTKDFTLSVLLKDPSCLESNDRRKECAGRDVEIDIDPETARAFGIEMVPAVVYYQGSFDESTLGKSKNPDPDRFWVVYGDATLLEAVEVIQREVKRPSLAKLVRKLEGMI